MKLRHYALLGIAALVLLALAAAAYFVATFDAKSYTPHLVEMVREKTGRTLTVEGDVKLSVWPDIAIETGPLVLSERNGRDVFAGVTSARLRLEWGPLLAREVVVESLDLKGVHVNIVRDAEGRLNIDDLLGREGPPARFDIGRVTVSDSALTFHDLATARRYGLSRVRLETGRLTNGVPTRFSTSFDAAPADAAWRLAVNATSGLLLDLDHQKTTFEKLEVAGKGEAGADRVEFSIAAARAGNAPGTTVAEGVDGSLTASGAAGVTRIKLNTPRLSREATRYEAASIACDVTLERGATRTELHVAGAVAADTATKRIAVTALDGRMTAEGPRVPGKKLTATARGSANVDIAKEGVHLELAGDTGGTRVVARVDAAGFASPVYTFAVDVDKLDLDRYMTKTQSPQVKSDKPEDLLQPFSDLPASGTLRIASLKTGDITARNVTLVLR